MTAYLSTSVCRTCLRAVSRAILFVGLLSLLVAGCARDAQAQKEEYFESGNKYFAQAKYAEAVLEYRNAVRLDPKFGAAHVKLAEAYEKLRDLGKALEEYVRAADVLPDDTDVQLKAGTYLLAARKAEDALARADGVLRRDPRNVRAHVLRGRALAGMSDFEKAIGEIEEAVRLDPSRGATFTDLGLLEMGRGKPDAAEAAFARAAELSSKAVEPQLALAQFYWFTNRAVDAERALQHALEIDATNVLANRAMAAFLLATRRVSEAEQYLKRVADTTRTTAAVFALTDYYIQTGRPRDAISRLEALPQNDQNQAACQQRLAAAYAVAGDTGRAHKILDGLIARDPKNAETQLLKAQLLLSEGKREEAFARVRAAVEVAPKSAAAQFALGKLYAARGDLNGAETAFREVTKLNPLAAGAQVELARIELASGRASASVETAQQAVRQEPGNLAARIALVKSLVAARDFTRAEQEVSTLLAQWPNVPAVQAQAGLVAAAKGDMRSARQRFERALALDPGSVESLAGLVAVDLANHDVAAAKSRVESRLAGAKPTPDLLLIAARTYVAAGDLASAEKVLRQAIDQQPELLTAYSMLGQLYLRQQKLEDARRQFDAVAEKQSRPVAPLTMAGMILYAQGKIPEARARFERVLAIDEHAAVAANNLAWIYAEAGEKLDTALQLAQTAVAGLPDSAEVIDTLGWVHYKKAQFQFAITAFTRAIERDPKNPTYEYHLGLAAAHEGDPARAKVALERALGLQPNFAGAEDARKVLASLHAQAPR